MFPEAPDNYAKLGTLVLEAVHSKLDSPGTAWDGVSVIHHMRSLMWVHLVPVRQSRGVDPTSNGLALWRFSPGYQVPSIGKITVLRKLGHVMGHLNTTGHPADFFKRRPRIR